MASDARADSGVLCRSLGTGARAGVAVPREGLGLFAQVRRVKLTRIWGGTIVSLP